MSEGRADEAASRREPNFELAGRIYRLKEMAKQHNLVGSNMVGCVHVCACVCVYVCVCVCGGVGVYECD